MKSLKEGNTDFDVETFWPLVREIEDYMRLKGVET